MSTTSFEKPVGSYRLLIRAKLLDEETATEDGALQVELEGTPGMEAGVEVETDRQAFELALGTMVVPTSWVQIEELSPDLLLSS